MNQQNQQLDFSELVAALPDDKFAKPQQAFNQNSQSDQEFNLKEAMTAAFAEPLYYPPLNQSVFPGDTVAIVVQNRLPNAKEILEALFLELGSANVEPSDISVVVSLATAKQLEIDPKLYEVVALDAEDPPPVFPVDFGFQKIKFQVHDAGNEAGLSYLVANEAGDPIMVNRTLVDADIAIPVGFAKAGETTQQIDCVYPEFGNVAIRQRFEKGNRSFLVNQQEIELANNTLGSFFSLQIIYGPGNVIQKVVCGARKDAMESARETTNQLWAFDLPTEADVVVATIEDHVQDQNWDDVVSAVITASQASGPDGPIVVWSNLDSKPDRDTRKACLSQFEESDLSKLSQPLQMFAGLLRERPVFLGSKLSRSVVEELGVGFVNDINEVTRIAEPHANGLLIRDAHKCQVKTQESKSASE